MRNPGTPGTYKLTCPFCSHSFPIKIVGDSAPAERQAEKPEQPAKPEQEETVITQFCSNCGTKLRIRRPLPGEHSIRCPKCQAVQTYNYKQEGADATKAPAKEEQKQLATKVLQKGLQLDQGCLVMQRGRFAANRTFDLSANTTVGRADADLPSDISIDSDPTMSRRSVRITAEANQKGFLYKLTVENATNKVIHNRRTLGKGDSVFLTFGDTITLGKTTFTFEKKK